MSHDLQAKGLAAAVAARKAAVQSHEIAVRQAKQRTLAAKQAFQKAKTEAEEEHPLDDNARQRFQQMPNDK